MKPNPFKPRALSLIILILLTAAGIAGAIILASNYIHIRGVVKPLNVSVSYVEVNLGELMPLQSFDTGLVWYDEVITTNIPCNVTIYLDTSTLSEEEINALGDPWLVVRLRNHTTGNWSGGMGANLSSWAPPYNYTGVFPVSPGVYDVGVSLFGKTGMPENETIIDFRLVVELRSDES